jgi:hypothetical protein
VRPTTTSAFPTKTFFSLKENLENFKRLAILFVGFPRKYTTKNNLSNFEKKKKLSCVFDKKKRYFCLYNIVSEKHKQMTNTVGTNVLFFGNETYLKSTLNSEKEQNEKLSIL